MRLWFWLASAPSFMATPFLRATATFPTKEIPESFAPELSQLQEFTPYTLIPQVMTADPEDFIRTAQLFGDSYRHIELNAGCPSPNCVGKGAGSSLLADPEYFSSMISTISRQIGGARFAVKMRTGFHSTEEFPFLVEAIKRAMSESAICRLTIHGRTRPQGYKGQANWQLIEEAARTLKVPVFASGDIADRRTLKDCLNRYPHVQGAIIGRGALRNPWIFEEIRTDRQLAVTGKTVQFALASFGLLQDLYLTNLGALIDLTKDGLFKAPCLRDPIRWRNVYQVLAKTAFGGSAQALSPDDRDFTSRFIVDRKTAGRMKLLWNYMRSSLPASFFVPQVLRSGSPGALLQAVAELFKEDEPEFLRYQPDYNWIFNGEKNERQALMQKQTLNVPPETAL